MREIKSLLLVLSVLVTFLIALPGCEGDEGVAGPTGLQGEQGPLAINVKAVLMPGEGDGGGQSITSITNSPSIPAVKYNDYNARLNQSWFVGGGRLAYLCNFPMEAGDTADMEIAFTKLDGTSGLAEATVTLPDELSLVDPPGSDVNVILGDDFEMTWNSVVGADAYMVIISFELGYYDTADVFQIHLFEEMLTITDTTISFAGSILFPDAATVSSIDYFYADADLSGISGVWNGSEINNITGDGMGFLVGLGYADDLDFGLVMPEEIIPGEADDKDQIIDYFTRLVEDQ